MQVPNTPSGQTMWIQRLNQTVGRVTGFQVARRQSSVPVDFDERTAEIWKTVAPYTMVSPERIDAVCRAVEYVVPAEISGAIVECGVWRGGATMAALLRLIDLNASDRTVWLYDSFEGMPAGGEFDVNVTGQHANSLRASYHARGEKWAAASLDDVKSNVESTGYPAQNIRYVVGRVEETIPSEAPEEIAILRLDTDWYESTRHELEHLVPRIAPNGVLIIDDYGHWQGARKAVDEYFAQRPVLLTRTDYSGRMAVLPG